MKRILAILTLLVAVSANAVISQSATDGMASDVASNLPAEQVLANAIAAGMTLEEALDELAKIVGSANIGQFEAAARNVLAAATGLNVRNSALIDAVTIAISNAAVSVKNSPNGPYPVTPAGSAFLVAPETLSPVATGLLSTTLVSTGAQTLQDLVPSTTLFLAGAEDAPPPVAGGGIIEFTTCEIVGSEQPCVD